jgi:hypothetical protein
MHVFDNQICSMFNSMGRPCKRLTSFEIIIREVTTKIIKIPVATASFIKSLIKPFSFSLIYLNNRTLCLQVIP